MIKGCALASGSSGNCFFIEAGNGFLVDAGISCKQIEERLGSIGKDISDINALFVTHEHADHIRGIDVLSRKHSIPIFINKETYESGYFNSDELINIIKNGQAIKFGGAKITAFSKSHDAANPVSYAFEYKNKKASVITDIGYACNNVISNVKRSNLLFLESNHDIKMLENGGYPAFLKKRIRSNVGHLSNYDAALLVLSHASSSLKSVVLSHLSQNNNLPELAMKTFNGLVKERKDLRDIGVHLSSREEPTELICV